MHRKSLTSLFDVLGDRTVTSVTRADCRLVREHLMRQKGHAATVQAQPYSPATVNRHLSVISSFFSWARREGLRSDNPCEGLRLKHVVRPDLQRDAFTNDEILALLGDPDGSALRLASNDGQRPSRYWIPLIALDGMRLEEIAQLEPSDIRQQDGRWCFDINARGGKRLKSLSSARLCRYILGSERLVWSSLPMTNNNAIS